MDLTPIETLHPRLDAEHGLLVLNLDHGKANEMGTAQLDALERLCEILEGDASVSCLCTTSRRISKRGTPIFISGANVTERIDWTPDRVNQHVVRQRELMRRIRHLPLYTTVVTHGVTLGWGTEFVLTADYCIATTTASFALPETGLGIIPGARGTAELAATVGPGHAMRLGCTGEQIDAAEARTIGLVHEVVDDVDQGLHRVTTLAKRLSARSPTAVASFKRALLAGLGESEADRLALEARAYAHCVGSGEAAIGRAAFADIRAGRTPTWGPRTTP